MVGFLVDLDGLINLNDWDEISDCTYFDGPIAKSGVLAVADA
jgi:hypothetical protein